MDEGSNVRLRMADWVWFQPRFPWMLLCPVLHSLSKGSQPSHGLFWQHRVRSEGKMSGRWVGTTLGMLLLTPSPSWAAAGNSVFMTLIMLQILFANKPFPSSIVFSEIPPSTLPLFFYMLSQVPLNISPLLAVAFIMHQGSWFLFWYFCFSSTPSVVGLFDLISMEMKDAHVCLYFCLCLCLWLGFPFSHHLYKEIEKLYCNW